MTEILYIGPKPLRVLDLPCPLTSLSEKTGEIVFPKGQPVAVDTDLAERLTTDFPETFVLAHALATPAPEPAKLDKATKVRAVLTRALTKRFHGKTGKWQAKRWLKNQRVDAYCDLVLGPYGWRITLRPGIPEELIPADAISVRQATEGTKETHERDHDSHDHDDARPDHDDAPVAI